MTMMARSAPTLGATPHNTLVALKDIEIGLNSVATSLSGGVTNTWWVTILLSCRADSGGDGGGVDVLTCAGI